MEKQLKHFYLCKYFWHSSKFQVSCFYDKINYKLKKTLCTHILMKDFNSVPELLNNERSTNAQMKKRRSIRYSFTDDEYNETSYYIENGLRKVYPYYFKFRTFAKARWCGRRILDVFTSEFRGISEPVEEYVRRINEGLLTVNNKKITVDYKITHNDFMSSTVHRHELPVTAEPIHIIHKDKEKLIINKPASIPVHPCGRYRHNTILFILAKECNFKNLLPVHRLDRLTSGILIFGLNVDKAHTLTKQIINHNVTKEYLCRVDGDFPNGVTTCKERIEVIHGLIAISKVSPNGKPCTTVFEKISYNGRTSLIVCRPITGRSHQIRVHLQYLGFPVVKDPLYNNTVFGPEKERGGRIGKSDDQLIRDIFNMEKYQQIKTIINGELANLNRTQHLSSDSIESIDINIHSVINSNWSAKTLDVTNDMLFNPCKMSFDENCSECKVFFKDPRPSELNMCLHAWKYKGPDWSYETKLPIWTDDKWDD
ncbi:hypothetical protein L9F63_010518 [Diploptera punctata]|uniref:Pseudouridine synthase n=1 Tax=Diploptera punctata TaxID=6984 RepID=A0AAD8AHS1_DIPPU|nr:hypothetical protein L9F63_010518 [Diploptera punctata]